MMIGMVSGWMVVVSDAVEQRLFKLVDGVMQSRDNPNPVTYPLKCVALQWWEPFSHHNSSPATWCEARGSPLPPSSSLSLPSSPKANPNRQTKQATRKEQETTKKRVYKRKPGPKTHCIEPSTAVSSTHILSRLQSVLIVLRPGLKRWRSQSPTAASTPYSPLQASRPGSTRRCSPSRVLRAHTFVPV